MKKKIEGILNIGRVIAIFLNEKNFSKLKKNQIFFLKGKMAIAQLIFNMSSIFFPNTCNKKMGLQQSGNPPVEENSMAGEIHTNNY